MENSQNVTKQISEKRKNWEKKCKRSATYVSVNKFLWPSYFFLLPVFFFTALGFFLFQ